MNGAVNRRSSGSKSPKLEAKTAGRRDEPDADDYLEPEMEPVERDLDKVVARLSRDIQAIRRRIDIFYQAAIFVVIFFVLSQIFDWLEF